MVVPWREGELLLCDIEDRGWCIPSGRVEPFESSLDAAKREAVEEAGAILEDILYLGCYRICERNEVRWADIYTARVAELVEIPAEFESSGRRFVRTDELAEIYYLWNSLTEAVILHAQSVMERHLAR